MAAALLLQNVDYQSLFLDVVHLHVSTQLLNPQQSLHALDRNTLVSLLKLQAQFGCLFFGSAPNEFFENLDQLIAVSEGDVVTLLPVANFRPRLEESFVNTIHLLLNFVEPNSSLLNVFDDLGGVPKWSLGVLSAWQKNLSFVVPSGDALLGIVQLIHKTLRNFM